MVALRLEGFGRTYQPAIQLLALVLSAAVEFSGEVHRQAWHQPAAVVVFPPTPAAKLHPMQSPSVRRAVYVSSCVIAFAFVAAGRCF
jgi:hypothetical protein